MLSRVIAKNVGDVFLRHTVDSLVPRQRVDMFETPKVSIAIIGSNT